MSYICENCGKHVTEIYGSGRFCSRSCANKRQHSEETKSKISKTLKKKYPTQSLPVRKPDKSTYKLECEFCHQKFKQLGNLRTHVRARHSNEDISKYNSAYAGTATGFVYLSNMSIQQLKDYRSSHCCCEICGKPVTEMSRQLSVDHNHRTMEFRGLLCAACNSCLGWFEKNEHTVIAYLDERGREFEV